MPDSLATEPATIFVCDCENWARTACAGEPFYKEHEGRRYCVLHVSAQEKSGDFKKALQRKLERKDFDFRGVWFPEALSFPGFCFDGDVNFSGATFSTVANFNAATFNAGACFHKATFGSTAAFKDAIFRAVADFTDTTFGSVAHFHSAKFKGKADFGKTTFSARAEFSGARFGAEADFRKATVRAKADFSAAKFAAVAYFTSVNFGAEANFRKANFGMKAYFGNAIFGAVSNFGLAIFTEEAQFSAATFIGAAIFRSAEFKKEGNFRSATFSTLASFPSTIFRAVAIFDAATFGGSAEFINCTLSGYTDFSEATFRDHVKFAGNKSSLVFSCGSSFNLQFARIRNPDLFSFHTLCLRPHWFVNVDTSKIHFINVKWRFNARQEIEALNSRGYGLRTEAHPLLAKACRHLAVNAEHNHDYEDASSFRYMAMDVRRRERWRGLACWRLSWWYWLASGYGERIWRAFVTLLLIWLVFAVAYIITGHLKSVELRRYADYIKEFVAALNYSLQVLTFQKPDKPTGVLTPLLVTFETILGPVQAALLALAIRRKFMR